MISGYLYWMQLLSPKHSDLCFRALCVLIFTLFMFILPILLQLSMVDLQFFSLPLNLDQWSALSSPPSDLSVRDTGWFFLQPSLPRVVLPGRSVAMQHVTRLLSLLWHLRFQDEIWRRVTFLKLPLCSCHTERSWTLHDTFPDSCRDAQEASVRGKLLRTLKKHLANNNFTRKTTIHGNHCGNADCCRNTRDLKTINFVFIFLLNVQFLS